MKSAKGIAILALMTALVAVATFVVKIPTVATEGYLNLGDGLVLFCGVVFGPFAGLLAGGLGSALADLIGGYAHWMLPTFLIKGLEGALAGGLFFLFRNGKPNRFLAAALASLPAALWMAAGYFFASWIMKGSVAVAWTDVPGNLAQGGVGVVTEMLLLAALSRIKGLSSVIGKNLFFKESSLPAKEEDPEEPRP